VSSVVVGTIAVSLILVGGLVLLVRRWGHASPR
jgi:nitrate reductase gamma subunit